MPPEILTLLEARPRLVLIRGLPGSGKSTLARLLATHDYRHFEADQHFEIEGVYRFDAARIQEAHYYCRARTRAALAAGHCAVVANTFVTLAEMQPYFDMLAPGAVCVLHAVGRWPNVHGVAPDRIRQMAARWQNFAPALKVKA